jgi:hypothetical protein
MKLRMLAMAAGFAVPMIVVAQTPTPTPIDTTARDTTASPPTITTEPTLTQPVTPEPITPVPTPEPTTPTPTIETPVPTNPTLTNPVDATVSTTSSPPVVPMAAKDSSLEAKPVPPSDGTTCPWGCPTSAGAAGLTPAQFLALQQELRDRNCGLAHVTGRLDAATRTAIRTCAKKLGVANNAGAVLVAMDVGFGPSDVNTSGSSGDD